MSPRRIAVIIGSRSDLPQCLDGLRMLQAAHDRGEIEMVTIGHDGTYGEVLVASIHRNTIVAMEALNRCSQLEHPPDVLIVGAGWANHLTGMSDAVLRYLIGDTRIVVIGVAFEDPKDDRHTMAAVLSISEVPNTQVIYKDEEGQFVGPDGFRRACEFAVSGDLPKITEPEPRPPSGLSLDEAVETSNPAT